jgi:hypothetical protein
LPNHRTKEQGITQNLSKFWMPLKEFTEKVVAGLQTGNLHIPIGNSADSYEKFNEKEKTEHVAALHKRMASMHKS